MTDSNYFLQTIKHLRLYEEVLLYANILRIENEHEDEVVRYLEKEFEKELLEYPCTTMTGFDHAAALWAARTVYLASQLMLYREHKNEDVPHLLPAFPGKLTAAAILSGDLVLRFLPGILKHLELIDPDDVLIPVLSDHLETWHFSAINYPLSIGNLNFKLIEEDPCLRQIYIDRVIEYKRERLAKHPAIISGVRSSLGMFADVYWNEFPNKEISD